MENLDELYELCEYLNHDLHEMNEKISNANGKLNNDTLSYLDKLTHTMKSVKTVIAMEEAEMNGYSGRGYSRDGMSNGSMSYEGGSYGGSYNSYDGGSSYARGRGSNAKRDNMGRYSRDGYSGRRDGYSRDDAKEDMMHRLNDLMNRTTEPQFKSELKRFADELEQM